MSHNDAAAFFALAIKSPTFAAFSCRCGCGWLKLLFGSSSSFIDVEADADDEASLQG